MSDAADIGEDHPLVLELASLRVTAEKYQHEAHAAAVKLQRHSLDTSNALEQTHALQTENAGLHEELEVLRAHPDTTPHPAALQVTELTLALRRLSDKLTSTEEVLLSRTTELAHVRSDFTKLQAETEAVHSLTAQAHAQVEQGRKRERELVRRVHAAEEERRLADLVVQEYADLVRTLEGRKSKSTHSPSVSIHASASDSSITLADSLAEGRLGLQKLLGEHDTEVERLSSQVGQLLNENELLKTKLEVEQKRSEADRESLAAVILELDKHRTDDSTATKMVSRYMKFSQSTIDSLQQAMDNLRTRHAATLTTFHSQIEHLHKAIASEHRQAEKLRDTLDELSEDISREAYGRRREVSLRLAFLAREEGLAESLRRWLRRSKEGVERSKDQEDAVMRDLLDHVLQEAESLLESLNGQPALAHDSPASLARVIAAEDAVTSLAKELNIATDSKLRLQRQLIEIAFSGRLSADDPFTLNAPPPRNVSLGKAKHGKKSTGESPVTEPETRTIEPEATTMAPPVAESSPLEKVADDLPLPEPLQQVEADLVSSTDSDAAHTEIIATSEPTIVPQPSELTVVPQLSEPIVVPQPPSISNLSDLKTDEDDVILEKGLESQDTLTNDVRVVEPVPNGVPSLVIPDGVLYAPTPIPASAPAPLLSFPSSPASDNLEPIQPSESNASPTMSDTASLPTIVGQTIADSVPASFTLEHPPKSDLGLESKDALSAQPEVPSLLFGMPSTPADDAITDETPNISTRLSSVKNRYRHLQKAFSDCNVTLKELKREMTSLPSTADMTSTIRIAVERLDDYNEDARVELEIRIADEERIIMGYETLLSVPGALDDDMDEGKLKEDIEAFIDGTNSAVTRATQQFTRKLDDLEHDIASIKRALYDLADSAPATLATPPRQTHGWGSWTAGILGGPSRPVSTAPTFGAVMTTPRMRQGSFSAHRPAEDPAPASPFASLGLRIAMPAHAAPATPPRPFLSPMSGVARGPRPRVSSTSLFALGLGARGGSFAFGSPGVGKSPSSALARSTREEVAEDSDSDIE